MGSMFVCEGMRPVSRSVLLLTTGTLLMGGCGPREKSCDPGESQSCLCLDGGTGTQRCLGDGRGWTTCDCTDNDADTDTVDDMLVDSTDDVAVDTSPDPIDEVPCISDGECSNGVFCDGDETCQEGECQAGEPVSCDDGDPCTMDRCDEDALECVFEDLDLDGDGYVADTCGGEDCDDSRDDVFPGALDEDCFDAVDQGCDGPDGPMILDEGLEGVFGIAARGVAGGGGWAVLSTGRFDVRSMDGGVVQVRGAFPLMAGPVWTGSVFAGLWAGDMDAEVQFHRVGVDGVEVGMTSILPVSGDTLGGLAWTGSEYGVFWRGPDPTDSYQAIQMLRVGADGMAAGSTVEVLDETVAVADVVWTGDAYFVWLDGRGVYSFSAEGSLLGSLASVAGGTCGEAMSDCMVWTGSELGVLWTEGADGDLMLGRFQADGMDVGSPVTLGSSGTAWPAAATLNWTGSQLAVAWWERDSSQARIRMSLVDGTGAVVSSGVELKHIAETVDHAYLELVWAGSEWFMLYSHEMGAESLLNSRVGWCW